MSQETLRAIPTCEVPAPVLEESFGAADSELPRVLRQEGGSRVHERRLLVLIGLFLSLAIFETVLLLRLPGKTALVVYRETPRTLLLETSP